MVRMPLKHPRSPKSSRPPHEALPVYNGGVTEKKGCPDRDIVQMIGPPGPNGARRAIRHRSDHRIELGVFEKKNEGEPISSDAQMLQLTPLGPDVFEVENEYSMSEGLSGPAQVSTEAYREGWDRIFGAKTVGQA